MTALLGYLIPDVPSAVKTQIQREKLLQREVLFETDDIERYWNGSPRGEGLSHMNDLFIYMIEVQGICEDFERLTGTIMLVR